MISGFKGVAEYVVGKDFLINISVCECDSELINEISISVSHLQALMFN